MKTASPELLAHLAEQVSTTCQIWRIDRTDSTVLGFTTLNTDLVYDGVTYYSARGGFLSTAISTSSDFSASNLDLTGFINSQAIAVEDFLMKKYDGAALRISILNYEDLSMGHMQIAPTSYFGPVTLDAPSGQFKAELQGISKRLAQNVGQVITKDCTARFCDDRCKLTADDWTVTGTVTGANTLYPRKMFTDSGRTESDGWFTYGELTWTDGDNSGYTSEVLVFSTGGVFTLFDIQPHPIVAGDTYSLIAGCDKLADTCKTKWGDSNIINFRGYGLFLPGRSGLLDYPDGK